MVYFVNEFTTSLHPIWSRISYQISTCFSSNHNFFFFYTFCFLLFQSLTFSRLRLSSPNGPSSLSVYSHSYFIESSLQFLDYLDLILLLRITSLCSSHSVSVLFFFYSLHYSSYCFARLLNLFLLLFLLVSTISCDKLEP